MGKKVISTIYIDKEILKKGKEIGLNISQFCENALKEAIKRLEGSYFPKETENNPETPKNNSVVGWVSSTPSSS